MEKSCFQLKKKKKKKKLKKKIKIKKNNFINIKKIIKKNKKI